jgi:hypothetical protein
MILNEDEVRAAVEKWLRAHWGAPVDVTYCKQIKSKGGRLFAVGVQQGDLSQEDLCASTGIDETRQLQIRGSRETNPFTPEDAHSPVVKVLDACRYPIAEEG